MPPQATAENTCVPTLDEIRDLLSKAGYSVDDERRTPDGYATQLRLVGGGIVTVYDKGSMVVGGKPSEKEKIEALLASRATETLEPSTNRVFVVYGHDPTARGDLRSLRFSAALCSRAFSHAARCASAPSPFCGPAFAVATLPAGAERTATCRDSSVDGN